ncbi:MAG: hypothetical protein ACK52I_16820 [Pseudomonadota bacterium]|jgi:hypothetical protein
MNKDIFRNFSLRKEIREIASPLHKAIAISESAIKARCQEYIAQRKEDIILTFQRTEEPQQNQMEILKEEVEAVIQFSRPQRIIRNEFREEATTMEKNRKAPTQINQKKNKRSHQPENNLPRKKLMSIGKN